MLAVSLSHMAFIMLRHIPSISPWWEYEHSSWSWSSILLMSNPRIETGDHRSYLSFQFYKTIYLKDKNSISKNNAKMISRITGRSGDKTNNIICPYQPTQSLLPYLRPAMTITKPKPLFLLLQALNYYTYEMPHRPSPAQEGCPNFWQRWPCTLQLVSSPSYRGFFWKKGTTVYLKNQKEINP